MEVDGLSLADGSPSAKFSELVSQIDDGSGQIDLKEFKMRKQFARWTSCSGESSTDYINKYSRGLAYLVLLFLFRWRAGIILTLSTSGGHTNDHWTGDKVPSTPEGVKFHYFYCGGSWIDCSTAHCSRRLCQRVSSGSSEAANGHSKHLVLGSRRP